MTTQEVLTLIGAGYTKADIEAMGTDDPKPAETDDPKPEQDNSDALQKVLEQNNELLKQIKELQTQNIKGAEGNKPENPNTAANIIKSFIEGK